MSGTADQAVLHALAEQALSQVTPGTVVGLGSGRAATAFVEALGRRVQAGLHIQAVPTSQATAALATRLGISVTTLHDVEQVDVAVDGADEVDPQLNLIKGLGGALVREKVVAAAARRFIVLVGPEKLVPVLGSRGTLPVEIIPFALGFCRRRLEALGLPAVVRGRDGRPYLTDNGNQILDCRIGPLSAPGELETALRAIPGVVGTGLFLDMAHTVIAHDGQTIQVRQRPVRARM